MPLVDLTDEIEKKEYEAFVYQSPYATATQDMAWSLVKNNWEPFYVYLKENDEIIAAMSILTVEAVPGKKLAYATRGPVCDATDVSLVSRLYDEAEACLNDDNIFLLRTDPEVYFDETLIASYESKGFLIRNSNVNPHRTIQPRLNMRLTMTGKTEDDLLAEFHRKTRYNIRLSKRKGVEVTNSREPEAVKAFYETHVIMSERQGITYRPFEYFERVMEAYGEHARIYLASFEGEILAGALCISYGKTTWYMYGGSTNAHRNLMPNYLMQWEMIKWGLEQGMTYYDFGGIFEIDESDGLYKFKSGFVGADNVTAFIGEIDRVYDEEAYQQYISK